MHHQFAAQAYTGGMKSLSQMEQYLASLVAIASTADNPEACRQVVAVMKDHAVAHGMHVQEWSDNGLPILLATTRQTLRPKVLFVLHGDVVDGPETLFTMRRDGGRLCGRGVWDMKFALAGSMALLDTLGPKLHEYDIGWLITSDEETRNHNVKYALKQGVSADCAVILDGGEDWQLEAASKGVWCTTVTVTGVASHGSRPWEGESASMALHAMLSEVLKLFEGQGPYTDTVNISRLHAGKAHNQVPDTASVTLDIRTMDADHMAEKQAAVTKIYDAYRAMWEVEVYMQPLKHDLDNAYLQAYDESARRLTRLASAPVLSYGGSDASDFTTHDIPCVVTRPKGGGHHADGEWIDRDSLNLFVPIFRDFLAQTAELTGR